MSKITSSHRALYSKLEDANLLGNHQTEAGRTGTDQVVIIMYPLILIILIRKGMRHTEISRQEGNKLRKLGQAILCGCHFLLIMRCKNQMLTCLTLHLLLKLIRRLVREVLIRGRSSTRPLSMTLEMQGKIQ